MVGGAQQSSLFSKMTSLADACRARFNTKDKLGIDDMIKLVTPSPIVDGTDILNGHSIDLTSTSDGGPIYTYSGTLPVGIPDHNKPITLRFSLSGTMHSHYYGNGATNSTLEFNLGDGLIDQTATVVYPASDPNDIFGYKNFTIVVPMEIPALSGHDGKLPFSITLDAKRNGTVMMKYSATINSINMYN